MAHVVGLAHGTKRRASAVAVARHAATQAQAAGFTHRCRDTVDSSSLTPLPSTPVSCRLALAVTTLKRARRNVTGGIQGDLFSFCLIILQRSNSPTKTPICLSGKLDLTCTFTEDRIFLALCGAVFFAMLLTRHRSIASRVTSSGLRSGRSLNLTTHHVYRSVIRNCIVQSGRDAFALLASQFAVH